MKQQISISLFNNEKEYLNALPKQDILNHYINNMIPAKISNESLVYYKGSKYSVHQSILIKL